MYWQRCQIPTLKLRLAYACATSLFECVTEIKTQQTFANGRQESKQLPVDTLYRPLSLKLEAVAVANLLFRLINSQVVDFKKGFKFKNYEPTCTLPRSMTLALMIRSECWLRTAIC